MTQPAERRVCRGCKTKLTYHPARKLFYGTRGGGKPQAVEFCTGCGIRATLHSTDPETPPTPDGDSGGDGDLKESIRRQTVNDK